MTNNKTVRAQVRSLITGEYVWMNVIQKEPMTAPDVNADVRAKFEADIARFYGHKPGRTFDRSKDGNYKSGTVQAAWNGYYIAHADLSGEVRELVEALQAARDYGAMTGDEWVIDKVDAALPNANGKEG